MPRKIDYKKVMKRHSDMLKLQKEMSPFIPTIRDLQKAWRLRTTSAVRLTIDRMLSVGLLLTKDRGTRRQYFAKPAADK